MDKSFNIEKTFSYTNNNIQNIFVNETYVIAKFGQKILFLTTNLEYIGEISTQYTFLAKDLYLDGAGNVFYCGGDYINSKYYCRINKISDIILLKGITVCSNNLNENIDYYKDVDIVNFLGNSLGTFTCDYSQVDNTKAGNYKAYYTFTTVDEEGIL